MLQKGQAQIKAIYFYFEIERRRQQRSSYFRKINSSQQFYNWQIMRGTIQRQKVSTALRNMAPKSKQQPTKAINMRQQEITKMSIVNTDSSKHADTKNKQSFNPFSTFVVPHNKSQSKILKNLMLGSNKCHKKQFSPTKSKSQRVRSLFSKNPHIQISHRLKVEKFLLKQAQEQANEKMFQMKNKRNSAERIQLQSLRKMSQYNLPENIQSFIIQEQSQTDRQLNLLQVVSQNQRSKNDQALLPESAFQLIQKYNRWKKDQAANKFKQAVKNKLSRKHIYRVLKQKSQNFSKIKNKPRSLSNNNQILQPTGFSQTQNVVPLHYGLSKSNFMHFYLSTFKHYSLPYFHSQEELKIDAKSAQLTSHISKSFKEQLLRSNFNKTEISCIEGTSLVNTNKQQETNPQAANSFELRKQQVSQKDKNLAIKRWKNTKGRSGSRQNSSSQGKNEFRQLTPWHGDYPE